MCTMDINSDEEYSDGGLQIVLDSPTPKKNAKKKLSDLDKEIIACVEKEMEENLEEKAARTKLTPKHVKNIIKELVMNEDVLALIRHAENPEASKGPPTVYEPKYTRAKKKMLSSTQTLRSDIFLQSPPLEPSHPHDSQENAPAETQSQEMEESCIPPDMATDMYDMDCDDDVWKEFLSTFTQPLEEVARAPEDDDHDPEYNVLADEDIDEVDTREELRADPGVTISRKELNCLLAELSEFADMFQSNKQKENEKTAQETAMETYVQSVEHVSQKVENVPTTTEPQKDENLYVSVQHLLQNAVNVYVPREHVPQKEENVSVTQEDQNVSVTQDQNLSVTKEHVPLLMQQIRQHIQMLAQNFLLTYEHPELGDYAVTLKDMLIDFKEGAHGKTVSFFNAANLNSALEVVEQWEQLFATKSQQVLECKRHVEQVIVESMQSKKSWVRYQETFPSLLMKVLVNSTAFLYPRLLAPIPFKPLLHESRYKHLESEDSLIALFLEQALPYIRGDPNKLTMRQAMGVVYRQLHHFLMPHLTPEKIKSVIFHRRHNNQLNPISFYFRHGRAPPTTHFVDNLDFDNIVPPCKRKLDEFSIQWREYIYLNYQYSLLKMMAKKDSAPIKQIVDETPTVATHKQVIVISSPMQVTPIIPLNPQKNVRRKPRLILPKPNTNVSILEPIVESNYHSLKVASPEKENIAKKVRRTKRKPRKRIKKINDSETDEDEVDANFNFDKFLVFPSPFSASGSKSYSMPLIDENSCQSSKLAAQKNGEITKDENKRRKRRILVSDSETEGDKNEFGEFLVFPSPNVVNTSDSESGLQHRTNTPPKANCTVEAVRSGEKMDVQKRREKLKQEFIITMVESDQPETQRQKTESEYFENLRRILSADDYDKFIDILGRYDDSSADFLNLFANVHALFNPKYKHFVEECLLFIIDIQSNETGPLMDYFVLKDMQTFKRSLRFYLKDQPSHFEEIVNCCKNFLEKCDSSVDELKNAVLPLIKDNATLTEWFLKVLSSNRSPVINLMENKSNFSLLNSDDVIDDMSNIIETPRKNPDVSVRKQKRKPNRSPPSAWVMKDVKLRKLDEDKEDNSSVMHMPVTRQSKRKESSSKTSVEQVEKEVGTESGSYAECGSEHSNEVTGCNIPSEDVPDSEIIKTRVKNESPLRKNIKIVTSLERIQKTSPIKDANKINKTDGSSNENTNKERKKKRNLKEETKTSNKIVAEDHTSKKHENEKSPNKHQKNISLNEETRTNNEIVACPENESSQQHENERTSHKDEKNISLNEETRTNNEIVACPEDEASKQHKYETSPNKVQKNISLSKETRMNNEIIAYSKDDTSKQHKNERSPNKEPKNISLNEETRMNKEIIACSEDNISKQHKNERSPDKDQKNRSLNEGTRTNNKTVVCPEDETSQHHKNERNLNKERISLYEETRINNEIVCPEDETSKHHKNYRSPNKDEKNISLNEETRTNNEIIACSEDDTSKQHKNERSPDKDQKNRSFNEETRTNNKTIVCPEDETSKHHNNERTSNKDEKNISMNEGTRTNNEIVACPEDETSKQHKNEGSHSKHEKSISRKQSSSNEETKTKTEIVACSEDETSKHHKNERTSNKGGTNISRKQSFLTKNKTKTKSNDNANKKRKKKMSSNKDVNTSSASAPAHDETNRRNKNKTSHNEGEIRNQLQSYLIEDAKRRLELSSNGEAKKTKKNSRNGDSKKKNYAHSILEEDTNSKHKTNDECRRREKNRRANEDTNRKCEKKMSSNRKSSPRKRNKTEACPNKKEGERISLSENTDTSNKMDESLNGIMKDKNKISDESGISDEKTRQSESTTKIREKKTSPDKNTSGKCEMKKSPSSSAHQEAWTREEDKLILQSFQESTDNEDTLEHISSILKNRTAEEINNRFIRLMDLLQHMVSS